MMFCPDAQYYICTIIQLTLGLVLTKKLFPLLNLFRILNKQPRVSFSSHVHRHFDLTGFLEYKLSYIWLTWRRTYTTCIRENDAAQETMAVF